MAAKIVNIIEVIDGSVTFTHGAPGIFKFTAFTDAGTEEFRLAASAARKLALDLKDNLPGKPALEVREQL